MEETIDEKELAFLRELEKHENRWVAIIQQGDEEIIVGSGKDANEAMNEAEARGFPNAALLRLLNFDRGYLPLTV